MNINNLKLNSFELEDNYAIIQLTSPDANVRVVTKDKYNSTLYADKLNESGGAATVSLFLPSSNHPYSSSSLRYCWALINRLATAMHKSKDDMYIDLIKQYSESELVSIPKDSFNSGGFKRIAEGIEYKIVGEDCDNVQVMIYAGIRKGMKQHELNNFIECIKRECEDLDIPTDTPSEAKLYG